MHVFILCWIYIAHITIKNPTLLWSGGCRIFNVNLYVCPHMHIYIFFLFVFFSFNIFLDFPYPKSSCSMISFQSGQRGTCVDSRCVGNGSHRASTCSGCWRQWLAWNYHKIPLKSQSVRESEDRNGFCPYFTSRLGLALLRLNVRVSPGNKTNGRSPLWLLTWNIFFKWMPVVRAFS